MNPSIILLVSTTFSIIAIDANSNEVVEFKIGVILIEGHGAPYDFSRSAPAIDIALEKVNRDILNSSYRLTMIQKRYGPECDAAFAPGMLQCT